MTDQPSPVAARRLRLSLDVWAVLSSLVLASLIWANLLPSIPW